MSHVHHVITGDFNVCGFQKESPVFVVFFDLFFDIGLFVPSFDYLAFDFIVLGFFGF